MSLHDAQGKVCFQGEQFPEKIHPINKKDLQRDFLKTIQPTYLLGILFLLPEVYMFPNWKTAAWGGSHAAWDDYIQWILVLLHSLSLLTPLSIQNRIGILSGESSLLYPKFHNKIGWVKAVKIFQIIQKVCIQQLVRRDLTTDYCNVTVFYKSLMALSHSLHQTVLYK